MYVLANNTFSQNYNITTCNVVQMQGTSKKTGSLIVTSVYNVSTCTNSTYTINVTELINKTVDVNANINIKVVTILN